VVENWIDAKLVFRCKTRALSASSRRRALITLPEIDFVPPTQFTVTNDTLRGVEQVFQLETIRVNDRLKAM
jgi:hypothetical protein